MLPIRRFHLPGAASVCIWLALALTPLSPTESSAQTPGLAGGDFDGDGKTDLGVFREADGTWRVLTSTSNFVSSVTIQWGLPNDIPVPGDYDGDGKTDIAVYRPPTQDPSTSTFGDGVWFILRSSSNFTSFTTAAFGRVGDVPVPGDYDGDGKTDMAVQRPRTGGWLVLRSRDGYTEYGVPSSSRPFISDIPVPGDFDGDGRTDVGVYRRSDATWHFRLSSTGFSLAPPRIFGSRLDRPYPADYDGDGITDLAVYQGSTGAWSVLNSATSTTTSRTLGGPDDIGVPSDYDGDGRADVAVHQRTTGTWRILPSTTLTEAAYTWGAGDRPIPNIAIANTLRAAIQLSALLRDADFDRDGRADPTVFRSSTGEWYSLRSGSEYASYSVSSLGVNGDVPVPGMYHFDRTAKPTIFHPADSTWHFDSRSLFGFSAQWGLAGDILVAGDYEGDGVSDLAIYRPGSKQWYVLYSSGVSNSPVVWGASGDLPVPGDYDGDGRTDLATYNPSSGNWSIRLPDSQNAVYQWGLPGDKPAQADFDGDGITDIAVYRPSTGVWYVLYSSGGFLTSASFSFGLNGDIPVPSDFDGDGLADIAVYRPANGVWYVLKSTTNYTTFDWHQWGLTGDTPVFGRQ